MKTPSIIKIPKDPVELISFFKGSSENIGLIKKTYSRNEFRKDHLFYSNSLVKDSIKRGLTILEFVFSLQLLFGKDIYIPGIGIYGSGSKSFHAKYSFHKDFVKLPISKIQRKTSFLRQVTDEGTGKINYDLYNRKTLGIIVKDVQKLYSNNITKTEILIKTLKKYIKEADLEVRLIEPYTGTSDFSSISASAKERKDLNIRAYLEYINMDSCLYNIQILEDILYTIGYIVAQETSEHTI